MADEPELDPRYWPLERLAANDRILVAYPEQELWRERVVVYHIAGTHWWATLSPDEVLIFEDLSDNLGFKIVPPSGQLPAGIRAGTSYRFRDPFYTPDVLRALQDKAKEIVDGGNYRGREFLPFRDGPLRREVARADDGAQRRGDEAAGAAEAARPAPPVAAAPPTPEARAPTPDLQLVGATAGVAAPVGGGVGSAGPRPKRPAADLDGDPVFVKEKADERGAGDLSWWVVTPGDKFGEKLKGSDLVLAIGGDGLVELDGATYSVTLLSATEADQVKLAMKQFFVGQKQSPVRKSGLAALRDALKEGVGGSATPANLSGSGDEKDMDARIMTIERDPLTKERWRDWRIVASRLKEQKFDDWPLEGPRTVRWLSKEFVKSGGGPLRQHQNWRKDIKAEDNDRSIHEHELLALAFELGGCYDQLDISALASFEVLARRMQLIEESKTAGGSTAYEGAKHFMGYQRPGTLVAPELQKHVASKLQEEVSVMKERRKHTEERKLARDAATAPPGKK